MSKKKIIQLPSKLEIHEQLNACINCVFENKCGHTLPFPINLCDCCDEYLKIKLNDKL